MIQADHLAIPCLILIQDKWVANTKQNKTSKVFRYTYLEHTFLKHKHLLLCFFCLFAFLLFFCFSVYVLFLFLSCFLFILLCFLTELVTLHMQLTALLLPFPVLDICWLFGLEGNVSDDISQIQV